MFDHGWALLRQGYAGRARIRPILSDFQSVLSVKSVAKDGLGFQSGLLFFVTENTEWRGVHRGGTFSPCPQAGNSVRSVSNPVVTVLAPAGARKNCR